MRLLLSLVFGLLLLAPADAKPKRDKHKPRPTTTPATQPAEAPEGKPATRANLPGIESELIKDGLQAYDDLDYPKAIELLSRALKETLTREETIATHKALGFCHAAINDMKAARSEFEAVLRIDRNYDLDRTVAPRVRAAFEEAKNAVATGTSHFDTELPLVVPSLTPSKLQEGHALSIAVTFAGPAARRVIVHYRTRTQDVFSRIEGAGTGGHFEATLPGFNVKPPGVDYYVEVVDDNNVAVAKAGSFGLPLTISVAARKRPVYKSPVLWGVLGGIVAAGGIAVGVVLGTRNTVSPNTPAAVSLQPF